MLIHWRSFTSIFVRSECTIIFHDITYYYVANITKNRYPLFFILLHKHFIRLLSNVSCFTAFTVLPLACVMTILGRNGIWLGQLTNNHLNHFHISMIEIAISSRSRWTKTIVLFLNNRYTGLANNKNNDFYSSAVNVISDLLTKKIKRLFYSKFKLECTLLVVNKDYSDTAAAR